MKECETEEILNMIDEATEILKNEVIKDSNFKTDKDGIVTNVNHTLQELRQKLINYLFNIKNYSKDDIEILKILFENK